MNRKVRWKGKTLFLMLTHDKVYEVISYEQRSNLYRVVDDSGDDYLYNNGEVTGVRCSLVRDRVENEIVRRTVSRYSDGEYVWTDEDIYHIEEYNIKLKDEFIDEVLIKMNHSEKESYVIDISQDKLFLPYGFKRHLMSYAFGDVLCYEAPNGNFYRLDHFSNVYVVEYAENEDEARVNRFEDTDTFLDENPINVIMKELKDWIEKYCFED